MSFTASNGVTVDSETQGLTGRRRIKFANAAISETLELSGAYMKALVEALDHERDEELGRWRWPHDPNIYVRPLRDNVVAVVRETADGLAYTQVARGAERRHDPSVQAGSAYFEAHPEPKPWHDAREGEVWIVTYNGTEYPAIFQAGAFRDTGGAWTVTSITDARRIWPEPSS